MRYRLCPSRDSDQMGVMRPETTGWSRRCAPETFRCASSSGGGSERRLVRLAGANPHHRLDRDDPDLAVTDLAGLGSTGDGRDDRVGIAVVDDDLEADLRHQRHVVLRAAVDL